MKIEYTIGLVIVIFLAAYLVSCLLKNGNSK